MITTHNSETHDGGRRKFHIIVFHFDTGAQNIINLPTELLVDNSCIIWPYQLNFIQNWI